MTGETNMPKLRSVSIALAALTLAAGLGPAHAAEVATAKPAPKVISSDTTLKIGQKGVVKVRSLGNVKVPVGIRVVKIQKGKPADLKGQGLPASTNGMVPFYIRVVLSYAGTDYHGVPGSFNGKTADGYRATLLITSADIGPCNEDSIIKVSKQQRTATACEVVLVPRGATVVAAEFSENNEAGRLFTVTWQK